MQVTETLASDGEIASDADKNVSSRVRDVSRFIT